MSPIDEKRQYLSLMFYLMSLISVNSEPDIVLQTSKINYLNIQHCGKKTTGSNKTINKQLQKRQISLEL